jgi:hypothetical protein
MIRKPALTAALSLLALLLLAAPASAALEDSLGGQIILSNKGFPRTLTSASSVKAMHKSKYEYDKEGKAYIYYLVFLKKAISGVSSDITVLDITEGLPGKVILTSTFLTTERGQRIYGSYLSLDEKSLPGDRKYRLVFSYHGTVIAKTEFYIKARKVERSGKVEFSEEEVKK